MPGNGLLVAYGGRASQRDALESIASLTPERRLDAPGPDGRGLDGRGLDGRGLDVRALDIRVLHVRESATFRGSRFFVESERVATELVATAVERLHRRGLRASGVIRDADRTEVATAIVAEALDIGAQAILLGGPLRGRLAALMFGSTSRGVLRWAPCPVFVAHLPRGRADPATEVATGHQAWRRPSWCRRIPGPSVRRG